MRISMYQASVPVFLRSLGSLSAILDKAAAHAEARKIDPAVLVAGRLYPDMFPFSKQVQIATDHAKGAAARLAGVEVPTWPDNETSFPELKARVQKTIDYLKGFGAGQIDGSDEAQIVLKIRDHSLEFKGAEYLLAFAMPNFYFHVTTAYAILRHNGVEIGKRDFLGQI